MTAIARLDLAHLAVSAGGFQIPVAFSRDVSERAAPAIKCAPYFALSPPFKQIPRIGFQESDVKRIFNQRDTAHRGRGRRRNRRREKGKIVRILPSPLLKGKQIQIETSPASQPSICKIKGSTEVQNWVS